MLELTKTEEIAVRGGFSITLAIAGIASGVIFLIGLVDGYMRPLKCRRSS